MAYLLRPVFVAFVATLGDFIWFEYGVRHTTFHGILHGALLLLAVGVVLGHAAGSLWRGALGGIGAGVAGALGFYAVTGTLGYLGGLIAAWAFMWVVLAWVNAWLVERALVFREWLVRGLIAAVASGAAFYLVSGIWTDRAPADGRNYVWHLAAWTLAWAPGLTALTMRGGRRGVNA